MQHDDAWTWKCVITSFIAFLAFVVFMGGLVGGCNYNFQHDRQYHQKLMQICLQQNNRTPLDCHNGVFGTSR